MAKKLVKQCRVCKNSYGDNESKWQSEGYCSTNCWLAPRPKEVAVKEISSPTYGHYNKKLKSHKAKHERVKHRNKKRRRNRESDRFYKCEAWLDLRFRVLKKYGPVCMLCRADKGSMHVDHIVPRSKDSSLALNFNNLQVLCKDCNLGKSNRDATDFRPVEPKVDIPKEV